MDTVSRYREIIKQVICEHAGWQPAVGEVETEVIVDESHDHYELMQSGWSGAYRIHGAVLHIDIRNGKVWIQHDGTEAGIATALLEAGIPKEHIVLAWKPAHRRQHTGFAVV